MDCKDGKHITCTQGNFTRVTCGAHLKAARHGVEDCLGVLRAADLLVEHLHNVLRKRSLQLLLAQKHLLNSTMISSVPLSCE
jgi:hypothetical protein